jgi:AcrR family transcriptional regulator
MADFQFGYRKTSMEDVAAAAEVSRHTLYLQFRNKERLFRAALEYLTEQMLVSIRRLAGNQNGTVEQTLMGVFEVLCEDSLAGPRSTLRSCWWSRDLRRKASFPASKRMCFPSLPIP